MDIFLSKLPICPSDLSDFIESNQFKNFCSWMFTVVIYRFMHCIMQNLKNAQVSIYSLPDLNIGH